MSKPRVKCNLRGVVEYNGTGRYIAVLDRLSHHPKLGPPRCGSSTYTSEVLRVDLEGKCLETRNTIYFWDEISPGIHFPATLVPPR